MAHMYKPGDKVIVQDGSGIKAYVGGWNRTMEYYVGKEYTIRSAEDKDWGRVGYRFVEDERFIFDERGLAPANEELTPGDFSGIFSGAKMGERKEE